MHDIASRRTSFLAGQRPCRGPVGRLAACRLPDRPDRRDGDDREAAQGSEREHRVADRGDRPQPAAIPKPTTCAARPMAAPASIAQALQDFDKAIAAQPEFLPGLFEPRADLPLHRRPGQGAGRLQPRHPDQRQLRRRLYRARRPLPEGRAHQGGLQRFPEGDPARHHRRPRLSPPRPDLPGSRASTISRSRISRRRSRCRRIRPNPTMAAASPISR